LFLENFSKSNSNFKVIYAQANKLCSFGGILMLIYILLFYEDQWRDLVNKWSKVSSTSNLFVIHKRNGYNDVIILVNDSVAFRHLIFSVKKLFELKSCLTASLFSHLQTFKMQILIFSEEQSQ